MLEISSLKINLLKNKTIAVFGFGSQGMAQSLNLKDSGMNIIVGLPENSKSFQGAKENDLQAFVFEEASKRADVIVMLIPDESHAYVFENFIKPFFKKNGLIIVAHGLSFHFDLVKNYQDFNIGMVAPKAVGKAVRANFINEEGIFGLYSIFHKNEEDAENLLLEYAKAIGCFKVLNTTFKEECETDLFGEQAVLCGGVISLLTKAFECLTEAGYNKEIAYYECIKELKLIVDLIYEKGISSMYSSISNTAKYGGFVTGDFLIDDSIKAKMKQVLTKIQTGEFAKDFIKASITQNYKKEIAMKYEENSSLIKAESNIFSIKK